MRRDRSNHARGESYSRLQAFFRAECHGDGVQGGDGAAVVLELIDENVGKLHASRSAPNEPESESYSTIPHALTIS
jgi:hypothetical protein